MFLLIISRALILSLYASFSLPQSLVLFKWNIIKYIYLFDGNAPLCNIFKFDFFFSLIFPLLLYHLYFIVIDTLHPQLSNVDDDDDDVFHIISLFFRFFASCDKNMYGKFNKMRNFVSRVFKSMTCYLLFSH